MLGHVLKREANTDHIIISAVEQMAVSQLGCWSDQQGAHLASYYNISQRQEGLFHVFKSDTTKLI